MDLVLLDVRLPGMDGIEVLERIKAIDEHVEVVLVTAVQTVRAAVMAMKLGAFDYVTKPFDEDEILPLIRRALERRALDREVVYLRSELARERDFDQLVGQHPVMQQLYQLISAVARNPLTVLIAGRAERARSSSRGRSTGHGPRRDEPFVPVNVAAISETLIESELFGHEKGAFTGAVARKLGKFELAHRGTLFLDEIATLRVDLQAKILRVLQEREIERVGGTRRIPIDVRVIAATNADLRKAIQGGNLREDLYYRLNVVQIAVPPLRDRREDIPLLVSHFIRRSNHLLHKHVTGVSAAALDVLDGLRVAGQRAGAPERHRARRRAGGRSGGGGPGHAARPHAAGRAPPGGRPGEPPAPRGPGAVRPPGHPPRAGAGAVEPVRGGASPGAPPEFVENEAPGLGNRSRGAGRLRTADRTPGRCTVGSAGCTLQCAPSS